MGDLLPDDWASLIYYGLLLLFIGGAIAIEFSGRGSQALRMAALWALIFGVVIFLAGLWQDWNAPRQMVSEDGTRIEVPMDSSGHFLLTAEANGEPVRFIVDTGASSIALSPEDARRIGLDPDDLAYIGKAETANGTVETAPVTIQQFAIGDIVDTNVPAVVIGAEISGSLLGMSYLRRFARVGFEGDLLILER
ncbi:retropepsin-like aspartic protease family protein [Paracoccus tegillarcae]|uniref:TIGR02281 family clan AA aspartic protease n=1 Tax=Paracoccus tegillarcae TaxID=1529068 RepID=A0A2K9EB82_9RHOB|nr:TIGR02281 family clan AA aspartic protease [Paracoccus tegillarcae]AUH32163.1 TIGR02281 family clan AA aspartic protease [Paracoccus tegillarcae]